jgi:hypothetical protein
MTEDLKHESGHEYPEGKNKNLQASDLINDIDSLIGMVEKDKYEDSFTKGYIKGLVAAKSMIKCREEMRKEK